MATFGDSGHNISVTMTPKDSAGTGIGSRTVSDTSAADVTGAQLAEFTIAMGTADTTVSLGNLSSFKHIVIMASEAMDNVYFSTVLNDIECAVGQDFVFAMGLDSEIDVLHIDCTGSSAAVDVKILMISEA